MVAQLLAAALDEPDHHVLALFHGVGDGAAEALGQRRRQLGGDGVHHLVEAPQVALLTGLDCCRDGRSQSIGKRISEIGDARLGLPGPRQFGQHRILAGDGVGDGSDLLLELAERRRQHRQESVPLLALSDGARL